MKISVGMLGSGFMGKTHTYAYRVLPFYYPDCPFDIKLHTAYSRTIENAEKFKNLGYENTTTCEDDILENPDINVVHVCTPNKYHCNAVLRALAAGKHVYCEKPLAASAAEAELIAEAARQSKGKLQVVFHNRFYPSVLRAKEMISEGVLGRILSFRAVYLHSGSVDAMRPVGWKQLGGEAGGVIYDLGAHVIDLICHLMGNVASVQATKQILYPKRPDKEGNIVDITAEDAAYILLTLENGAMGTCELTKIATGANDELRIEIHGDKGAISLNMADPEWLLFYDNTLPNEPLGGKKGYTKIECVGRYPSPAGVFPGPKYSVGWLRGHVHSLYSFLQAIKLDAEPSPNASEGAYVQSVLDDIKEACSG